MSKPTNNPAGRDTQDSGGTNLKKAIGQIERARLGDAQPEATAP